MFQILVRLLYLGGHRWKWIWIEIRGGGGAIKCCRLHLICQATSSVVGWMEACIFIELIQV
jgi:hypothetical protein